MRTRPQARGYAACADRGGTVEVGHIDGEERHSHNNLFWTCRKCNVICGNVLRRAGLGRRTRQLNPSAQGAQSLGQWLTAVFAMKGDSDTMSVADAVAMIRATPPEERSRFAREIWTIRKRRGTDRSAVPF